MEKRVVIICKKCGQKLAVPSDMEALHVVCPKCKNDFYYHSNLPTSKPTFIEEQMKKRNVKTYEYEDAMICGEILYAKERIAEAIALKASSITWCYDYESYDSIMHVKDSLSLSGYSIDESIYKTSHNGSCGEFNRYNAIGDFLISKVGISPSIPKSIDWQYIERKLTKELSDLGCKHVSLFIGPKEYKYNVLKKKSIWGNQYEEKSEWVTKWLVSVSW